MLVKQQSKWIIQNTHHWYLWKRFYRHRPGACYQVFPVCRSLVLTHMHSPAVDFGHWLLLSSVLDCCFVCGDWLRWWICEAETRASVYTRVMLLCSWEPLVSEVKTRDLKGELLCLTSSRFEAKVHFSKCNVFSRNWKYFQTWKAPSSACACETLPRIDSLFQAQSRVFALFLFGKALKAGDKDVPSLRVSDWGDVNMAVEVAVACWGGYPLLEAAPQSEAASCPRHTIVVSPLSCVAQLPVFTAVSCTPSAHISHQSWARVDQCTLSLRPHAAQGMSQAPLSSSGNTEQGMSQASLRCFTASHKWSWDLHSFQQSHVIELFLKPSLV